jgi:hypothetical protein
VNLVQRSMAVPAVALDAVECTFPATGSTDESYTAVPARAI